MNSIDLYRLACGATLAAAIALAAPAANAQTFEGEGLGGILKGFGLADDDDEEKAAIDFRERAPLVVPPSRQLPPPGTTGSIAAPRANFPVDADRKDANIARARKLWDEQSKSGRLLTADEMRGDTLAPGSKRGYQTPQAADRERNTLLGANEIKQVHKIQEAERWDKGEPTRTRLSDPPVGYRAPAATAPYVDKGKTAGSSGGSFWSKINPF
jgi:hypothetical protein